MCRDVQNTLAEYLKYIAKYQLKYMFIFVHSYRSMFEHVATLGTGAFGEVDLVRKRDGC